MKKEQLRDIEKKWLETREQYGADCIRHFPLPVICAGSLADAEYITDELVHFIYKKKLLEKTYSGHADYLICPAPYTGQSSRSFPLIQEIYRLIRNAGGCYGAYRGVILMDVSEWSGHFRENYFDILLSYLADLSVSGIVPFFYADSRKAGEEMPLLCALVSSYFRSVQISLGPEDLYEHAVSLLQEKGVRMDESASEYLEGFIREAARSPLFHGAESVGHICDSILSGSMSGRKRGLLKEKSLKDVIQASGCMEIYRERSVQTIGFR